MKPRTLLFIAISLLLILGCQLTGPAVTSTPAVPQPTATATSVPCNAGEVCFDVTGLATGSSLELVEAIPATEGGPYWEGTPAFRRYTLTGYPITEHRFQPQIFVFAVADMPAANKAMAQYAADLQALLQTHQAGQQLPFLPISSDGQLTRSRLEFVDFKAGSGVQFLTQLGQGLNVLNNHDFIFAYQGLTFDGKYYVAAILPVTYSAFPATPDISDELKQKLLEDFPGYLNATVTMLDGEKPENFFPNLITLSALVRSIDVR